MREDILHIFPVSSHINKDGMFFVGGCSVQELAEEFGTPLYIYDEETIRCMCREYRDGFSSFSHLKVFYASKAYTAPHLIKILVDEGLGVDVVSAGELFVALEGGMDPRSIAFHGNGKERSELEYALDVGVSRIIVDNMDELSVLSDLAKQRGKTQNIMLRITPGVDAKTHHKTTTGVLDSKFGFSLQEGQAENAVKKALSEKYIELLGFHIHLGSPIYTTEPYQEGIALMCRFAAQMKEKYEYEWSEFSPGGGFAIGYTADRLPLSVGEYGDCIFDALKKGCAANKIPIPEVHIEPGRSLVGRAGVAVYSVVSRNSVPGVRDYVTVNGGMADNIRVALYGSQYEVFVANKMNQPATYTVTIAGKYCESGDILVKDAKIPSVELGDTVVMPSAGAYQLSMESNYNMALRPAVVFVKNGEASLVRARQKVEDLI